MNAIAAKLKVSNKILILFFSAVLLLLISVIYAKTINFGLINHDDYRLIVRLDSEFKSDGIIKKIFTNTVFMDGKIVFYRPLMTLSFYIDNRIAGGGISLKINHATNVLLHSFFVLLLFYFLRKYCFDLTTSFFASSVFTAHFILNDTVAWVSGRNDSILALFVLASFIFFIRYNEKQNNKAFDLILHCVFYFSALLTKESALVLPFLCFIYSLLNKYPKRYPLYVLWFLLSLLFLILRYNASGNVNFWALITNISLLKSNIYMVCDYLSASFCLSKIELYPEIKIFTYIKGFFVFCILCAAGYFSKNRKYIWFYLLFAVMFLLPNFFINRTFFQGNRIYLSLAAIIISISYSIKGYINTNRQKAIACLLSAILIFLLTAKSYKRADIFENEYSYIKELKASGNNRDIILQYVLMWKKYGFYRKAIRHLEITEGFKQNKQYVEILIEMYLLAEEFQKAAELLEETESIFTDKKRYYEIILFCYKKTGNIKKENEYKSKLNEFSESAAEHEGNVTASIV
jgi:tetratricopeptide (TPR) repeat protein